MKNLNLFFAFEIPKTELNMSAYLSCPLCVKSTLSDVQELQTKIASVLCRSLHCPICSASLLGLPSLHFHLATHIPIPTHGLESSLPASPEQIPCLEKLDIRDIREESNSPGSRSSNNGGTVPFCPGTGSLNDEELSSQGKSIPCNCDFCGLVFSSDYFLTLHKDIMHSEINEFEVECKQCKSRFKNLEAYRDHVKEEHRDRRYICDQCPKSFKMKGGLLVHTRMFHDRSSPSSCQVCKKHFTSKARRELHERRYHAKKVNVSKKSPPIPSPNLNDIQHHDLDEAENCFGNLMHEKNQQNRPKCVQQSVDSSPVPMASHISFEAHTPSPSSRIQTSVLLDIQGQNQQSRREPSPQSIGQHTSSLPPILSPCEDENLTKYKHFTKYETQPNRTDNTSDTWKNHGTNDIEPNLQPLEIMEGRHPFGFSTLNTSGIVPPFHFNNISYSLPKYSDFKFRDLGSFFPISPLEPPACLNGQAFLPNSDQSSMIQLHNSTESTQAFHVPINSSPKISNHPPVESTNALTSVSNTFSLTNKIASTEQIIPLSQTQAKNPSNMKIPTDYTITIPPNVNMNISCLVNTMNSQKNIINKVKGASSNACQPTQVSGTDSRTNNKKQNTNQLTDHGRGIQKVDEISKPKKLSLKRGSFCQRGSESKHWECDECKKSFTTKYFLKKHKRLHTGETPYACEECGKTFTFQQSYHKHVFYHSDDKPHICPHCNRAFKEMSTLHNHIRIHTGEKPFVCSTCDKSFRQRVSYLVHQRIHTGILPYRCEICNRAFRYKVSLRSHKCEGRNLGETSPTLSKNSEEPTESFSLNATFNNSVNCQTMSQDKTTNEQNPCLRIADPPTTLNELPGVTIPPGVNGEPRTNLDFRESGPEDSSVGEQNEKQHCEILPYNYPRLNINLNTSLTHSNSIEKTLQGHSSNPIQPKLEVSKSFPVSVPDTEVETCLHPENKFDQIHFPHIIGDFPSVNLDEELDNDTFLKSLFS